MAAESGGGGMGMLAIFELLANFADKMNAQSPNNAQNAADVFAEEFNMPKVAEVFGAEAQKERDERAAKHEATFAELNKLTGTDIRANTKAGAQMKMDTIDNETGTLLLESILAGKDPSSLFGGL